MANFDAGLASGYVLRLEANETATNASANQSTVSYTLKILKGTGSGKYADGPHYWSATIGGNYTDGSFSRYDFRNYSELVLTNGSYAIGHNANGSGSVAVSGGFDDGNTWGVLGDNTASGTLGLSTLTVTPGQPSSITSTRVSDTSITVGWTNSSAGNGQPTGYDVDTYLNGVVSSGQSVGAVTSVSVSAAANQKIQHKVRAYNAAGYTGYGGPSTAVYTTPAAPTNATATKTSDLDITVAFTTNVGYSEYTHAVGHGTVSGGVTTWDDVRIATLASGVTTWVHESPDPAFVHTYRVRSEASGLTSGYANTGAVQLLTAPNKPSIPDLPAFVDKAQALVLSWTHNTADTTPQTAYEFGWSINNGSAWSTTGKLASTASSRTMAANTYAAGTVLISMVRTWGSATTGGSEGTGASPWSDVQSVTYKSAPTVTITSPATGSSVSDATLRVSVAFAQAEGASHVSTRVQLLRNGSLLEDTTSTLQSGITLATEGLNGVSYTVRTLVKDSNGLSSGWASSTFTVNYLAPVPAVVSTAYIPDTGYGQVYLSIAAPTSEQSTAVTITITRTIDGDEETVVSGYPASSSISFLDTTPTINGTNTYRVITTSSLGAQSVTIASLVTDECRRAYLSKGASFDKVVAFGANLSVSETLSVASDTIEAAGRVRPIGLYGVETSVQLKVQSFVFEGFGSEIDSIRAMLLLPGKACYRDPSGRRVFGSVKGSVAYKKATRGDLSFTMTETS